MKIKIAPKHLFAIIFIFGLMGFTNAALAKNCTVEALPTIEATIDILDPIWFKVTLPDIKWTCYADKTLSSPSKTLVCYLIAPTEAQKNNDYSFLLRIPEDPKPALVFTLTRDNGKPLMSMNGGRAGKTPGTSYAFNSVKEGDPYKRSLSLIGLTIITKPSATLFQGQQFLTAAGTYIGSYQLVIREWSDYASSDPSCENGGPPTYESMAGMINLKITVSKNCLIDGTTDIDFGRVDSFAAMRAPAKDGTISIRCTYNAPYHFSFDQGQNSLDGKRRMKSANGKNFISYKLCQDSKCTMQFTNSPILIGKGGSVDTAIRTSIFAQLSERASPPPAGVYRDTVVVTITY